PARAARAPARAFSPRPAQHVRGERSDRPRRFDEQPPAEELREESVPAPASSASGLTPDGRRILEAIDRLPEGEREAFDLVRIQGMSQTEAARVLEVSVMTVNRRLNRGLQLLAATLGDLYPGEEDPAGAGPDPGRGRARSMTDDPRLQQLLDQLLDSHATPEEVCRSCPELLPVVRDRWRQMRCLRADLDALFPAPDDTTTLRDALLPPGEPTPQSPEG